MNFPTVKTLEELDSLDDAEITEGYRSAERGDPEPGPNRGKSFWHGWCCRMRDLHEMPMDPDHFKLVGLWLKRERERKDNPVSVEGA